MGSNPAAPTIHQHNSSITVYALLDSRWRWPKVKIAVRPTLLLAVFLCDVLAFFEKGCCKISTKRAVIFVLLAGLCWSASGIGVRLIEVASVWQIVLHRSVSMSLFLSVVIYVMTRQNPIHLAFRKGFSGLVCGLALVVSYVAGIYSLKNTSVANTLLLFSTAPFLTAVLARIFLGEDVRWQTWVAIAIAMVGVLVMVLGDTRQDALLGDLAALAAALGFAVFTILLRRGKSSDMMPAVLLSGLVSIPIMALLCVYAGQPLAIQFYDYAISTTLGIFQMGMGLLLFTLGSRALPAANLTLLSLSEVFFAPLWVWIFLNETISEQTLLGGGVLFLAIVWNIMSGQRQDVPAQK